MEVLQAPSGELDLAQWVLGWGKALRSRIVQFCKDMGTAFAVGDLDSMIAAYRYPLGISSPNGWRLETSPQETRASIFARRAAALAVGLTDVEVDVGEMIRSRSRRFTVDMTWRYLGGEKGELGRSRIRYYCLETRQGTFAIEMIEFREIAFAGPAPSGWALGARPS